MASRLFPPISTHARICLLYTSDAADERSSVDLGGRRIIKKKINTNINQNNLYTTNMTTNRTHHEHSTENTREKDETAEN